MKKATLSIPGMNCKNCQAKVEGALNELEGVKKVKINLNKKTAKVKYDQSVHQVDQLTEAVGQAGYESEVVS